ncbi:MAG: glycosyl hydrolase family 28-related protein [Rickettsiales bacterium]
MDFNVKDYGAKGDGVTNDTLAIQKALDAAYKAGGGTVILGKGTFIVKGTSDPSDGCLLIKDNVTLSGAGMGQSIIKLQDNWNHKVTGIVRTESGVITKNVTVQDLTIDGNMQHNVGEVDGVFCGVAPGSTKADENITFQRMEIHSVSRYGFDPHEITKNLVIRDSVAHHNGKDGFVADFQMDGTFENNIAYANGRHGFNIVTGTVGFVAKDLTAYDNGSNGIVVQRGSDLREWSRDVRIEGGQYYHNGEEGILVKISKNVTVTGAEVFENVRYGIHVAGSNGVAVYGNRVHDNAINGGGFDEIRVDQYDDRAGATGQIWGSKNVFVTLNNIYTESHKSAWGVRVMNDTSSDIHVHDNMATGSYKGDAWFSTNTDTDVSGMTPYDPLPPTNTDDVGVNFSLFDRVILGDPTHDSLIGGAGKDYISGHEGNDTLKGGSGDDVIKGGIGADSILGDVGNDDVSGGAGADYLEGGRGADTISGGDDNDTILSGSEADSISGDKGDDYLSSFDGNDYLNGGEGNDDLRGGAGNDTLVGGPGNDMMYGGTGYDKFVIQNARSIEYVNDFQHGIDKIDLSEFTFTDANDLKAAAVVTEIRGGVNLALDADTTVQVKGLLLADLSDDDFIF